MKLIILEKVIISDTSCLITLSRIYRIEILKQLYSEVQITSEVEKEFGGELPDWVVIRDPNNEDIIKFLKLNLDDGEATSIALAYENKNSILIIDERKGRKMAISLGLHVIGLLGIILRAKNENYIHSVAEILEEIEKAGFRVSKSLKDTLLKKANEI